VDIALNGQYMNLAIVRIRIDGAARLGRAECGDQSVLRGGVRSIGVGKFRREFRVNRFRTAERSQQRGVMPVDEFLQKWMLTPEIVIHAILRLARNDFAVIAGP